MRPSKIRRKNSIAGFTLLEVLVVIIIIAILFAIAAPGWTTLMNRQRVNSVREQAAQLIRQAQSDARRTHTPRIVVFDPNPTGIPRAAIVPQTLDPTKGVTSGYADTSTIPDANWQTLGNGDIKSGAVVLTSVAANTNSPKGQQLVFDSNGAIDPLSEPPANTTKPIFAVTVAQAANNAPPATRRCVIIKSLLGATYQDEGSNCPSS